MSPTLTCTQASDLLDAFLDAELPGPMLLAVARHAGACPACDGEIRERSAVHDAVEQTVRAEADALDLSGVWPAVAAGTTRADEHRIRVRRLRTLPMWAAAGVAVAASAVLWFQMPGPAPDAPRVARARPNHAVIDRLASEGARVALRSERKNGTMLIMVNSDEALP